jgi:hypothetical protein
MQIVGQYLVNILHTYNRQKRYLHLHLRYYKLFSLKLPLRNISDHCHTPLTTKSIDNLKKNSKHFGHDVT